MPDRNLPVVLRDLSEHGALVECTGAINAEADVYFIRNDLRVQGYVAWVRGKLAGISFGRPLKADVVLQQIARPARRTADQSLYRRPAVGHTRLSTEEQRLLKQMAEPVDRSGRK